MTDESAFQAALDENPRNHDLRMVFADWLEEQGDWRAAGYRWMGQQRKHPYRTGRSWDWWDVRWLKKLNSPVLSTAMIDSRTFTLLEGGFARGPDFREYDSRWQAEEALCRALQKLADFSLDTAPTRR